MQLLISDLQLQRSAARNCAGASSDQLKEIKEQRRKKAPARELERERNKHKHRQIEARRALCSLLQIIVRPTYHRSPGGPFPVPATPKPYASRPILDLQCNSRFKTELRRRRPSLSRAKQLAALDCKLEGVQVQVPVEVEAEAEAELEVKPCLRLIRRRVLAGTQRPRRPATSPCWGTTLWSRYPGITAWAASTRPAARTNSFGAATTPTPSSSGCSSTWTASSSATLS